MATIWVHAELSAGSVNLASLELVSGARRFADTVEVFVIGPVGAPALDALGVHGATVVYDIGEVGDALAGPRVAAAMAERSSVNAPDAVFFASSYDGRDAAARLSARLDRPVLANVIGLEQSEAGLSSQHELFGATLRASAHFTEPGIGIFIIRAKAFSAEEGAGGSAHLESLEPTIAPATDRARVVGRQVVERSGPDLDVARIVVTGGRGLGEPAAFAMIERLAELLDGAPAATRAVVDAGWVPYSYQVGQTGKTVKPELYFACGVSGATQHLVGMKGARHIVAINRDPQAPMLKMADLAVVGDVHDILPKLIAALEQRRA